MKIKSMGNTKDTYTLNVMRLLHLEIGEDIFVLNAKEKGDTNELYRELSERCKAK